MASPSVHAPGNSAGYPQVRSQPSAMVMRAKALLKSGHYLAVPYIELKVLLACRDETERNKRSLLKPYLTDLLLPVLEANALNAIAFIDRRVLGDPEWLCGYKIESSQVSHTYGSCDSLSNAVQLLVPRMEEQLLADEDLYICRIMPWNSEGPVYAPL